MGGKIGRAIGWTSYKLVWIFITTNYLSFKLHTNIFRTVWRYSKYLYCLIENTLRYCWKYLLMGCRVILKTWELMNPICGNLFNREIIHWVRRILFTRTQNQIAFTKFDQLLKVALFIPSRHGTLHLMYITKTKPITGVLCYGNQVRNGFHCRNWFDCRDLRELSFWKCTEIDIQSDKKKF